MKVVQILNFMKYRSLKCSVSGALGIIHLVRTQKFPKMGERKASFSENVAYALND